MILVLVNSNNPDAHLCVIQQALAQVRCPNLRHPGTPPAGQTGLPLATTYVRDTSTPSLFSGERCSSSRYNWMQIKCVCTCRIFCVFLIFTPSLLHRKSGSGECVMVNLSRAIPCPLDTSGRDCLPQSTQPTNALMESLFSSKVRPSSVFFHLALHLWF